MAAATKASSIGWMFVPQYYTFVNKDPSKLHCFYTKKSTLIHGVEGEDCQPCYGQQEIHEKIMALGFEDCKVFVSTVDSQSSAENGIVVQVVGELSNKGGPWRKFAQTFFLAEQPNGYFVLNDIFRYIKEESDDEESTAGAEEVITPAASNPTAPADVLSTLDQPIGQHAHHDFELAAGHGAPGDAAGVTVAPPMAQQADSDARASLAGLVNGDASQEHVVELHDEINEEQPQQSGHAIAHQPAQEDAQEAQETEAVVQEATEPEVEPAPEPVAANEPEQPQKPEQPAPAAPSPAQEISVPQTVTSTPAPSSSAPQPAAPAQAAAPAPSKPSAPKSWASLAASGSHQWKNQVVSETRGVSTSKPASKVNSGTSTPATQAPISVGPSTPAAPASEKGSNDGFITAGPRKHNNNNQQNNSNFEQGEGSSSDHTRTRTPHFNNNNVETGYSIVVSGVHQSLTHAQLRNRLSDEFAKIQEPGRRKEWAKLSYLDIDRSKETAYVDFENEWAMKRAIEAGQCSVEGTTVTITGGRGGRRDASAIRSQQQSGGGGRGRGGGPQQQGGDRRGPGGGPGRGGLNAPRGGQGARAPSGRGQ